MSWLTRFFARLKGDSTLGSQDAPPSFPVWLCRQEDNALSVQDALDDYIAQYGLLEQTGDVPKDLARQRLEVALLEEWIATYAQDTPPEFKNLLHLKRLALQGGENLFRMRRDSRKLIEEAMRRTQSSTSFPQANPPQEGKARD